jgi:expansin (peptidoglycan-binding protein)
MSRFPSSPALCIRNIGTFIFFSLSIFFCADNSIKPSLPRAIVDCNAVEMVHTGEATFYGGDGSGNCCFPATPNNRMIGAMNNTDYDESYSCGACVEVTGPSGTIDIRITDQCPECKPGDIDLSDTAFAKIAAPERGRVSISWRLIPCPVTGPIVYHFKNGSNPWWTAVQIRNHRYPLLRFVYKTSGTEFSDVSRTDYNYFVKTDGMGHGPYIFQITDLHGHALVDTIISPPDSGDVPGSAQFPLCE